MRIAIAHDWLLNRRGSERVLREFCRCFADLAIYTLFFDPEAVDPIIRQHSIFVSRLNSLPGVPHYYRYLLPWFPRGIKQHFVQDQELLVSISHGVAKGIPHSGNIPHICYCQSPMRFLWEPELYGSALSGSWKGRLLGLFAERLRQWDLGSNDGVDHFVSTSRTVQKRIQKAYGVDSHIIHPCIDLDFFQPSFELRDDFYLIVSALVPQKRLELAIEAFNENGRKLLVAGTGPLTRSLTRRAGPNIQFLGWLSDVDVRHLYRQARALVLAGPEEFGLVPIEAQACGCPVIAFGEGGITETMREGESGLFFQDLSAGSLREAIELFERQTFDAKKIVNSARRFSSARFRSEWNQYLGRLGLNVEMC